GEIADGARGREFDGGVVDRAIAIVGKVGGAAAVDSGGLRVELRRALLESAVEIPDHGLGVEGGAVMEAYATTQLERPFLAVAGILLPALGEARNDVGGRICFAQVPVDKGVEGGEAHETHALETVVGRAGRG